MNQDRSDSPVTAINHSVTYAYDGTGMRAWKNVGGKETKFYWDRGNIINEGDAEGIRVKNYFGQEGIIGREENGSTDLMIQNARGDVAGVMDNGTITKNYDYTAYGVEKEKDEEDTNPFRYCGEYYDEESGLLYLRARYYDPNMQRFINEDPAKDGLNWYSYCAGDPINFIDSTGLYRTRFGDDGSVWVTLEEGDTLNSVSQAEANRNYVPPSTSSPDFPWEKIVDLGLTGFTFNITGIYGGEYPNPNPNAKSGVNITPASVQQAFQNVIRGGDYDGAYGLQCVDLTMWFIDTYTTLKSTTGNGWEQAANTAKANGLPSPSSTPRAMSVFSVAGGYKVFGSSGSSAGHTGIVLSVDEVNQTVTVIHTGNSLSGKNPNSWISTYSYNVSGVTYTYLEDYLK